MEENIINLIKGLIRNQQQNIFLNIYKRIVTTSKDSIMNKNKLTDLNWERRQKY